MKKIYEMGDLVERYGFELEILKETHHPAFPDRAAELEYIKFLEEQDKQWDGDK